MAHNKDTCDQVSKLMEIHSDDGSSRSSLSHQKKLNFNDEAFLLEEQAHLELEEAEKRAEELHERLHLIYESKVPSDRGEYPEYMWFLVKN